MPIVAREIFGSMTRPPVVTRHVADPTPWTTCGCTIVPPLTSAAVRHGELHRGDRHALAERSVGEVDLAPRLDGRIVDVGVTRDLAGDIDPGLLPEAQPAPRLVQDAG